MKYTQYYSIYDDTVVLLPPYHPDVNPIKMTLAYLKQNVSKKIYHLVEEKCSMTNEEEWFSRNICYDGLTDRCIIQWKTKLHTPIKSLITSVNFHSSTVHN